MCDGTTTDIQEPELAEDQTIEDNNKTAERTAQVVSAYVSNNAVPATDLPGLIESVYMSLHGLGSAQQEEPLVEPAVNPKRSVKPDHIVCLECGKKFKSLKRHIGSVHDLTPEDYRARWNLAADYPMVAPDYAEQRSKLALSMGLGRKPAQKSKKKK